MSFYKCNISIAISDAETGKTINKKIDTDYYSGEDDRKLNPRSLVGKVLRRAIANIQDVQDV
jgi:hypothetical protein